MGKIKTRDMVKGTIRTLDKGRIAASRMKDAYIHTKDKAEDSVDPKDSNANEYAGNTFESGTKKAVEEGVDKSKKLVKKGAKKVKDKIERKIEDKINNKIEKQEEKATRDSINRYTQKASQNAARKSTEKAIRSKQSIDRTNIRTVEKTSAKSVKQSARASGKQSIKTAQKGTVKTVKTSVKTAEKTSKTAIKTSQQAAKTAQKAAKASVKAAQKAAQAAKAAAQAAVKATKAAIQLLIKVIKAIIAGIKALASAIAAGGWVAVVIILVICLIALILCSCFGVFASGEDSGTGITMRTAVSEINAEYNARIEEIKNNNTYDQLEISGTRAPWKETIAIYAVWKNMSDLSPANPDEPVEVATMTEEKKEDLRNLFWEMNSVTSHIENYTERRTIQVRENGRIVDREISVTNKTLYITTSHVDLETMMDRKGFTEEQRQMCYSLLDEQYNSLWLDMLHGISGGASSDIVKVAQEQLGNVGGQPYWSWYGFGSRVEWCACFVSWCANECGYIEEGIIPMYSLVDTGVDWFKGKGQWLDGNEEPQEGMIIFFDWAYDGQGNDPDHTGIVEKVEDGLVYTIEGNSGDACVEHTYPIGYFEILGYGAPEY